MDKSKHKKKKQIEGTYVWNHIKKDFWLKSNGMKVFDFFTFFDGKDVSLRIGDSDRYVMFIVFGL